jgi:hypothetical protein
MAENQRVNGAAESLNRMTEAFFNTDLRKAAALYIDFIESLTKQMLDFQENVMGWAKETPLEPLVELQTSISRKLAETSISAARSLCQIQTPAS